MAAMVIAAACFATALTSCSSRSDATQQSSSEASSAQSAAASDAPQSSEQPAATPQPTPTAQPESAPETSDIIEPTDESSQLLAADARMFIDWLGPQQFSAPTQLKSEEVLAVCLTSLYLQRELMAYIFEEDGEQVLIPSSLLSDAADERFGLEGFLYPASDRFDQEKEAYRYDPKASLPYTGAYEMSNLQGNEDGTIGCTATFPDDPDAPSYIYAFRTKSLNGTPYLQIVSAHPVDVIE